MFEGTVATNVRRLRRYGRGGGVRNGDAELGRRRGESRKKDRGSSESTTRYLPAARVGH